MFSEQQMQILKLIKERKNTPIDLIANEIFKGNKQFAVESINQLEKQKLVEYSIVNMIRISLKGKDLLNSMERS